MAQDWTDVGDRIRAARTAAGISQTRLAEAVGLDRTMVVKIEAGTRRIDALELVRIASALDVPLTHFVGPQPPVLSRRTVGLTEDTETEVGRESNRLDIALASWIADLRQLIALNVFALRPPLTYPSQVHTVEDARDAARWLRRRQDLGDRPIASLMDVCSAAGQSVLVTDVHGDGASAVDGDLAAAVVSRHGDPGRRRATAAHELGHLVLGDEYSSDLGVHASRAEREALIDAFAAELLVPASVFARLRTPVERGQLLGIAATYRTSWSLVLRQADLAGAGPVPRQWSQSKPTRAEFMEALGWTPLPDLDSVRVPPSVADAVMRAWREGLITRSRALELMHGQLQEADLPPDADGDVAP